MTLLLYYQTNLSIFLEMMLSALVLLNRISAHQKCIHVSSFQTIHKWDSLWPMETRTWCCICTNLSHERALEVDSSAIIIHAPVFLILKLREIKPSTLCIMFAHIKDVRQLWHQSLQRLETGRKSRVGGLSGRPSRKMIYLVWFATCHLMCVTMMPSRTV